MPICTDYKSSCINTSDCVNLMSARRLELVDHVGECFSVVKQSSDIPEHNSFFREISNGSDMLS